MIDPDALDEEIKKLEKSKPSLSMMQTLSCLYIVRDHMGNQRGASDFLRTLSKYNTQDALKIIDELMTELQLEHPEIYQSFMDRL